MAAEVALSLLATAPVKVEELVIEDAPETRLPVERMRQINSGLQLR